MTLKGRNKGPKEQSHKLSARNQDELKRFGNMEHWSHGVLASGSERVMGSEEKKKFLCLDKHQIPIIQYSITPLLQDYGYSSPSKWTFPMCTLCTP
jgi:hypothetical protein